LHTASAAGAAIKVAKHSGHLALAVRGVLEQSPEAIAECIRSRSVWEAESNIELLALASIPAAADRDASFTMERVNFLGNIAKAFRRKCEFD
jgi:hypothetical protein